MSWTYAQNSGRFVDDDGKLLAMCYAGAQPDGVNNPDAEAIPFVGPIPCGGWTMTALVDDSRTGPNTILLLPKPETQTFGRDDFRIHGDSIANSGKRMASQGCIIMDGLSRLTVWKSLDHDLTVVATIPQWPNE